jgi:hypothetical protein
VELLATTNGGLEFVAAEELADLIGAEADRHHRGVVGFETTRADVYDLHARARRCHRVLETLVDGRVDDPEDVYDLTRQPASPTTCPTRTSASLAPVTALTTSRASTSPTGSARPSSTATARPPGRGCRSTSTTSPELLPLSPTDRYDVPYGRNDATIVVGDR